MLDDRDACKRRHPTARRRAEEAVDPRQLRELLGEDFEQDLAAIAAG